MTAEVLGQQQLSVADTEHVQHWPEIQEKSLAILFSLATL